MMAVGTAIILIIRGFSSFSAVNNIEIGCRVYIHLMTQYQVTNHLTSGRIARSVNRNDNQYCVFFMGIF